MAGDVQYAITRVAAEIGVATQDVTIAGFGTPKGVAVVSSAIGADGVAAHAKISIGSTDGITDLCHAVESLDGSATSVAHSHRRDAVYVRPSSVAGPAIVNAVASFDSWVTDGVRFAWDVQAVDADLLTVILFRGDDFTPYTERDLIDASFGNGAFQPNFVLGTSRLSLIGAADSVNHLALTAGFAVDTGASTEYGTRALGELHGQATKKVTGFLGSTELLAWAFNDANDWNIDVTAWATNAVDLGFRTGSGAEMAHVFSCLFNGLGLSVKTIDGRITTGLEVYNFGFAPGLLMALPSDHDVANAIESEGVGNSFAFGVATPDAEYTHGIHTEDARASSNTGSFAAQKIIHVRDGTGALISEANVDSWDSDGITLNYTTVPSEVHKHILLAVEKTTQEKIFIGGTPIKSMSAGSTPILKAYVGSTQVWP